VSLSNRHATKPLAGVRAISAVDLLRGWRDRNPQIRNIVMFVSDALRWDYTPESILSQGTAFKTVASGSMTAISFPSILTGLYPSRLGVFSFTGASLRTSTPSLLNLPGYNSSLWTENTWVEYDPPNSAPLYRILNEKRRVSLKEIEPPFVYLEDEKGGHCPYGWSPGNPDYEEWDCAKFFRDSAKKGVEFLKEKYHEGVARTAREFEKRMKIIRDRGLEDSTLVIFLSDHGESLGEHGGIVGHEIMASELTYVPVVLMHPDLPKGRLYDREGVLRHVDLYPTLKGILRCRDQTTVDGTNLLCSQNLPRIGYTYNVDGPVRKGPFDFRLIEIGVWDNTGGYIFREGLWSAGLPFWAAYKTLLGSHSNITIYQKERLRHSLLSLLSCAEAAKWCSNRCVKCGVPSFSKQQAVAFVHEFSLSEPHVLEARSTTAEEDDEKVKARLRALGYWN